MTIPEIHHRIWKSLIIISFGMIMISANSPAWAVDYQLTEGAVLDNGGGVAVMAGDTFSVRTQAFRSYECTAIGQGTNSEFGFSSSVFSVEAGAVLDSTMSGPAGGWTPTITGASGAPLVNARITFITQSDGLHRLTVISAAPAGEQVRVLCRQTTVYAEFNTNGTHYNFLEMVGETNGSLQRIYITALDSGGNYILNNRLFYLDYGRRDIDLHSLVGPNRYGQIIITHAMPYGALTGYVSRYAPGTSADEPLILRGQTPLRNRDY